MHECDYDVALIDPILLLYDRFAFGCLVMVTSVFVCHKLQDS